VFVVGDERVSVIVAITPLLIVFSLIPKSKQLLDPGLAPQERDLLALRPAPRRR